MPKFTVERDEKLCEVRVRASILPEALERHYVYALKCLQKETKADGFRPGHIPISEVLKIHGEGAVLQKAAELAVQEELPNILARESIAVVDTPRVMVEKLERGKPLEFSARAPLPPSVELPDYKNIAKKHNEIPVGAVVSDEEYNHMLMHLRRERARVTKMELGVSPREAAEQAHKAEEKDLPGLDDAFVKTLGYENLEKFSDSVRTHLKSEKERHEAEKRRAAMLDELVEQSKIYYPAVLKEFELDDMEARLKADLERMQTTFDAYLAQVKKTREELRKEWEPVADKRTKIRLILGHVAHKENITADKDAVEKNLEHARTAYPNANPEGLRANITHALQNEAVLKFLEK